MKLAVAVDLGASSARFALGRLAEGRISYEIIEQIPHHAVEWNGKWTWDSETLLGLCRRAADYAHGLEVPCTIGIDSWGVDHGFVSPDGKLLQPPVCYRDESNTRAAESLTEHRPRLYELTGIQYQPFNSINQLLARTRETPELASESWLLMPDLLGHLLGGEPFYELTQASTTQLVGLDGKWCDEAFRLIGMPKPNREPELPGTLGRALTDRVTPAHVGSHDTASAVCGFGNLQPDQLFLNVGTWALVGCVLDRPLATAEAREANFTNERCVDGRVRFLKNVSGFYIVNRLHEELGVKAPISEWLNGAGTPALGEGELFDVQDEALYAPASMVAACSKLLGTAPVTESDWARVALQSVVLANAVQPRILAQLTGREFHSIRVGGGGSQSADFCQSLADRSGLTVLAGPAEATVLGNLAAQFLAQGAFASWAEAWKTIEAGVTVVCYDPRT
jgi:rhamnulokinase